MSPTDPATLATPPAGVSFTPGSADPVLAATLDLVSTLDLSELEAKILSWAGTILTAEDASLWTGAGPEVTCYVAVGDGADRIAGLSIPLDALAGQLEGEETQSVIVAPLRRAEGTTGPTVVLRVTRESAEHGAFATAERDAFERLAAVAGVALRNIDYIAANDRSRDLELVMEMSREIGSTLDLDRVMQSVVNLAMRALIFDRGAIALYERGACDIRAVAGTEKIDPDDPELQDLATRGAWAAGVGESFYLSDRKEAGSDAERTFLQIFADDLEADGVMSGLYLPLRDDEGVVGILVFESSSPEFATERQRELAAILARQATVAVRNAQLYNQVPLADALGALQARKEALLALPRQRRIAWAVLAALFVGSITLIRWPLRVDGRSPLFRPTGRAEIRPLVEGVVERVFVREGATVARGAALAQLRDVEPRAERDAALAAAAGADRSASVAASRGDAAEERLQRLRSDVLRREAAVLDEQVRSALVRSPVTGVVLTPRPEERLGSWAAAGAALFVVGRTDTLELEMRVDPRDVGSVRVGDELRLRVDAFPQRTFVGHLTSLARVAGDSAETSGFPVRALVPNDSGLLRPGMSAYARVLTEPTSLLGRVVREPARRIRLFLWRMWS